ncbi:Chromatin structure-remodeling complex subunit RSC4 [Gossypium arboreum]|uniref:Chromatin structure-remodeling complex subunit RSC4 n=1 Tax=Gossypium arboreum TaxID=29729 RepID=A0A0B0PJ24_GOSAR|nr:Chromatin structure-remodeling complex subunit RSC4 [Gossypium arboreum]
MPVSYDRVLHMAKTHDCVSYTATTRVDKYKAIFQVILSPSQHTHTYYYNSIQQGLHRHLNVHKHVMIMSISHAIDI